MEDQEEAPAKQTWLARWYHHGRASVEVVELQRARQFDLFVEAKGELRTLRSSWREARKRQLPTEFVADLAEAMEAAQDAVNEAKESYTLTSAERDRRVADSRANLSLLLSCAAFGGSIIAPVVAVLTFLLKGWR